jgi:protein-disulfide isomerase
VTIAALVAGAVLLAFVVMTSRNAPPAAIVAPAIATPAGLQDGQALGRPDAPVTVDEYVDFQCPYCGALSRTLQPRIVADFVATGKVRLVAHDLAFLGRGLSPDESTEAAVGAACALQQRRYWPYRDYLFANQFPHENSGAFSRDRLVAISDAIGLDRSQFEACLADPTVRTRVATDTKAAFADGIDQTPTLVIDGVSHVGLPTYEQFATLVAHAAGSPIPSPSDAPSSPR